MPITKALSSNRVEIKNNITVSCINELVADEQIKYLQTCNPITKESWTLINDLLIPQRPDIQIRVYGHYSQVCDLTTLSYINNVENLAIDCLRDAQGIESIENLSKLKSLSVGIYNLDNFNFLKSLPATLEKLILGATKSKKPKLDGLLHFAHLKELYIDSQSNGIELVGDLSALEKIVLRSVSPDDISFIRKLSKLWSLDIKLGGIKDLSAIADLHNLKYLELWQIRELSDISVIESLSGLQYLFIQSLRNVKIFPNLEKLYNLRRIYLETMKGLTTLDGLFLAPNLREFIHVCAQNMTVENYERLKEIKSLEKALIRFGSNKKNNQIDEFLTKNKIAIYSHEPFIFNKV